MTNIRVTYFWMSPFSLLPPVPFAFSYVPRPSPPVCSRWIHRVRVSCTQIEPLTRSVSDLTVSVNIKRSESERARKRESTRAPYLATCRTWGCAPVLLGRAREQEFQTIRIAGRCAIEVDRPINYTQNRMEQGWPRPPFLGSLSPSIRVQRVFHRHPVIHHPLERPRSPFAARP